MKNNTFHYLGKKGAQGEGAAMADGSVTKSEKQGTGMAYSPPAKCKSEKLTTEIRKGDNNG